MLRIMLKYTLLVGFLVLLLPRFAAGQTRDDLRRSLDRLDHRIQIVQELVQDFDNARGRELLEKARRLRGEAVSDAQRDNLAAAGAKIKLAFSFLEQAVKVTLEGPIRRLRNQLESLLQRADSQVLGSRNKEAVRLLKEAKKNREAAERKLAAHQINRAVEHFRVGINLAELALKAVHKSPDANTDRIEEERRKFESLRERVQNLVAKSGNAQAKQIYEEAMKLAASAEESLRKGNLDLAKRFYNQSVLLLLRAMDLTSADSPSAVNQVEVALFRLRQKIADTREAIVGARRPRAAILFERARRFASDAELAARQGREHEAMWKIDLAENMLQRARRIARSRGEGLRQKIESELRNTRNDLAEMHHSLQSSSSADAKTLLKMAEFAVQRAEKAHAAGMNRLALEGIWAAQRFLTGARRAVKQNRSVSPSRDQLVARLGALDAAISESEGKLSGKQQVPGRRLLESAIAFRQFSYESLQKGNYRAADEGIQVAFELIRKSLRNTDLDK